MDQEAVENLIKKVVNDQKNVCVDCFFRQTTIKTHFAKLIRDRDENNKTLNNKLKHQSNTIEILKIQLEIQRIAIDNYKQYANSEGYSCEKER